MDKEEVPLVKSPDLVAELTKDLQTLVAKYNTDMTTLNRILSTYEDEISSLKNLYHDLSFRFKQMNITQQPQPEE